MSLLSKWLASGVCERCTTLFPTSLFEIKNECGKCDDCIHCNQVFKKPFVYQLRRRGVCDVCYFKKHNSANGYEYKKCTDCNGSYHLKIDETKCNKCTLRAREIEIEIEQFLRSQSQQHQTQSEQIETYSPRHSRSNSNSSNSNSSSSSSIKCPMCRTSCKCIKIYINYECPICTELKSNNVSFLCGHVCCEDCKNLIANNS